jgi:hypothetical protein
MMAKETLPYMSPPDISLLSPSAATETLACEKKNLLSVPTQAAVVSNVSCSD